MTPRRWIAIALLLTGGCAPTPDIHDRRLYGPTTTSVDQTGYVLQNRQIRLVIDPDNGDVTDFSPIGETASLMICATLSGIGSARPIGHIEARDDQTWVFIGEDQASNIGWRKIYSLDGQWLDVTYLIQNLADHPISAQIGLVCNYPSVREPGFPPGEVMLVEQACFPHFIAFDATQIVQQPAITGEPFLRSDVEPLNKNDRMSWTMRWWIEPVDGRPR